ncbi:MAG: LLM class flavin-dependent oxidoreductase [Actinomycetota bacterium]
MRLALEVWGADVDRTLSTCRRAEELGFDGFYLGESPTGLNLECWTMLAALAQATATIRLGPVITNVLPTYRSTMLLGRLAATVAVIARGRLDFRTGVGASVIYGRPWWEPFGVDYGSYAERAADLDAALGALRPFWAGEPVTPPNGGSGEVVIGAGADGSVSLGFAAPVIPVTVAAVGPTGLDLAARHAEVWESSFRTPAEFAALDAEFRARADAVAERSLGRSGRSGRSGLTERLERVERSLEIDAFVGTDGKRASAAMTALHRERSGEDLDRVVARALVGPPSQVGERLAELAAAGVDQVVIAAHDPHDPDALEALARGREEAGV